MSKETKENTTDQKLAIVDNKSTEKSISKFSKNPIDHIANNPQQFLEVLEVIAKGANTGVQTTGDALMLVSTAKEFNIGMSAAMRNINVIKGKVTLSYHLMKAIMTRNAHIIKYERIRDYEKVFLLVADDGTTHRSDELPDYANIVPLKDLKAKAPEGKQNFAYLIDSKKTPPSRIMVDIVTSYKFERRLPDVNNPGKFYIKTIISSYSRSKAQKANMYKENGPWETREDIMIDKTAYVLGAREIAPDLYMGMYGDFELSPEVDTEDFHVDTEGE